MSENLKWIKAISSRWSLNKKAQNIKDLVDIEFELKRFHDRHIFGLTSVADKDLLIEIESHKNSILLLREKEAHQKSRALWLSCGDDNTPFFTNLLLIGNVAILFGNSMMILEILLKDLRL